MTGRSLWFKRPGVLLVVAAALLAAHAAILRYVFAHATLSAALVSGVIVVIVIKHLGVLGSLLALFRRRSRSR